MKPNQMLKRILPSTILTSALVSILVFCGSAVADEKSLEQRVSDLEKKIVELELLIEGSVVEERWKDPNIWLRIKQGMTPNQVKTLLGAPDRIAERIFTSWYYDPKSDLHAYVWFDEGVVLGTEFPED